MPKRSRSAKQKANDKRLGAMARARGKKSTPKRRRSAPKRKTNKARRRSTNMARRKAPRRRSSGGSFSGGFINKIPILKNKTVQKVGLGLGMARIASTGARFVPVPMIQNNARLIGTAVAFAVSPLAGIVDLALGGGLGGILGGGSQGGGGAGFA